MTKEEELLRKLRGHLAHASQMEPYKVFTDENLNELLKVKPKTLDELKGIKGFPEKGARVSKYGQSIVDIFNKANSISGFDVSLDKEGEPVSKTLTTKKLSFGR